ncbi:MAG: hypothetical protein WC582_02260 [Patescibacteria group bacterium]
MQEQEYEIKVNGKPVIVKNGRVTEGGEGAKSGTSFEEIKRVLGLKIGVGHEVSIGNRSFRRVSGEALEEYRENESEKSGSMWVGNGNSAFGHWHS